MRLSSSVRTARGTFKPAAPDGLVNASLRGMSVTEAEHALAMVWQRIEECGTEAPSLTFGFGRDGSIDIEFSFSDRTAALFVLDGLTFPYPPPVQSEGARTGHGRRG